MTLTFPTQATVRQRVGAALGVFTANDLYLVEKDLNERAIAHKFAEALQTVFRSWHVDCEYNRDGIDPKRINWPHPLELEEMSRLVIPDIIIHRRGSSNNLLAIEVKKASNLSHAEEINDHIKLQAYLDELGYRYALFIVFNTINTLPQTYRLEWFPTI